MKKINQRNVENILSLTPMQEGILFHYLKSPKDIHYFEQLSLELTGFVDTELFKSSWNLVIKNNEMLRTAFRWEKLDNPIQLIFKEHKIEPTYFNIEELDHIEQKKHIEKIKQQDKEASFDLHEVPFRVILCRRGENKYTLIISNHHILYDGWSNGIILREFFDTYTQLASNSKIRPKGKAKYKDYIKLVRSSGLKGQEKYWKGYLKGLDTRTPIPIKRGKEKKELISTEAGNCRSLLNPGTKKRIDQFVKNQKLTQASIFYSAWGLLLQKYCNNDDVVIGTTVSGRNIKLPGIEEMVGLFINTLPLRVKCSPDENLNDIVHTVNNALKTRQEYETTPLVKINEYSEINDKHSGSLFDSIVVIENYPLENSLRNGGGNISIDSYGMDEENHYDLTLTITSFDNIEINLGYNTDCYSPEIAAQISNHFIKIVDTLLTHPECKVTCLDILEVEEKHKLLYQFNDTNTDYPWNKTIHQQFEEQAEKKPEQEALVAKNQSLTFIELNRRAKKLAQRIRCCGAGGGSIIGIYVERSYQLLISMMAVLKAGGAYLPLEPGQPKDRIDFMTRDSDTRLIITTNKTTQKANVAPHITELNLDNHEKQASNIDDIDFTDSSFYNNNETSTLAYVIYTSGSTGQPKGVMISHKAVSNFIEGMVKEIDFSPGKTILSVTNFSFDIFVLETLLPMARGLRIILADEDEQNYPERLTKLIEKNSLDSAVHMLQTTPSRLKLLSNYKPFRKALGHFTHILAGGETFPAELLRDLKAWTNARIYNMYGPTETTVWSSIKELTNETDITVGTPIANTHIYIVDKNGRLQPPRVPGELCIGGDGLARGYMNRPELTAEKFIPNHLLTDNIKSPTRDNHPTPDTTDYLYRTGDLASWRPDGNIEHHGRLDYQVKLRGYRIELGEIETRLLKHDSVKEAAVILKTDEHGDGYISAYVVLHQEQENKQNLTSTLKDFLGEKLPSHMIPSYIMPLGKMPLNSSGKINRNQLPEPVHLDKASAFTPLESDTEKKLAEVWSDILNIQREQIGKETDFFKVGGHSLKAMRLSTRIHKDLSVEVPLSEIYKNSTVEALAEYITRSENKSFTGISPVEQKEYYKLSPAQNRLYILHRLSPNSKVYNITGAYLLTGQLEKDKIEAAFRRMIDRHDSLRTTFFMNEGQPVQKQQAEVSFEIEYSKNTGFPNIYDFVRSFDLSQAPLMRVGIITVEEKKHVLMVDMHHIISDGTSLGILIKEFAHQYNGVTSPPPAIQYKDYSNWQNQRQETDVMKDQESYWLKQFSGELPLLNLPTDAPRPASHDFKGNTANFTLGKELTQKLNDSAKQDGVSLFMLLLAAMNVYLAKLSGQEHIVIGTPNAGRNHYDLENIVGMFVNTLAIAGQPTGEKTFKQFLAEVKTKTLEAFENQDYQFEDLVDKVVTQRDTSRNPLFDVMFGLQNMDMQPLEIPGLTVKPYSIENRTTRFDMTFLAREEGQQLHFTLEYSTALFKEETIKRFIGYFRHLVEEITTNTHREISRFSLISAQEKQRLQQEFNRTNTDYPADKTIHQLFQQQAEAAPDHIVLEGRSLAAQSEGKSKQDTVALTYRELDSRTHQLAHQLRAKGVEHGSLVGLQVERSVEIIIAILAILKADGAYLPIDPAYPTERIRYMQQDSNTVMHLEERELLTMLGTTNRTSLDTSLPHSPLPDAAAAPAYVLYTSGSSGRPKGVLVKHRNVVRLVQNTNYIRFQPGERLLQTGAIEFDASTFEIWGALLNGMVLCIAPKENMLSPAKLKATIRKTNTNTMWLTSPLFNQLAGVDSSIFEGIENLLVGGDVLSPGHINAVRSKNPSLNIINGYGPTENTTFSTTYLIREEHTRNIPIGTPIANSTALILDKTDQTAPIGIAGELHVGGDGIAHGYLNNPELTAEKFITLPFTNPPALFYKTGDQARWTPNGTIEFLGRIDQQVKIRGYRIELEEIENRLLQSPQIKDARVICRQDGKKEKTICAYIVPHTPDNYSTQTIRENLERELPDHMIPSHFVTLEKMPLTPNGKVDTRALPEPGITGNDSYRAPATETESQLVNIWSEVLDVAPETIGIHDNFFHRGGHSLKAVGLISRIHKEYSVEIPLTDIFEKPTIEAIAKKIQSGEQSIYKTIEPVEKKEYYELSPAQSRQYVLNQISQRGTEYNIPATFEVTGKLDASKLETTFRRLIQRHEALRTSFVMIDEKPVQRIHDIDQIRFQVEECESTAIEDFINPFDLTSAPLLRVGLAKCGDQKHTLLLDMHHIISDGTTVGVLVKEFIALYNNKNLPEPAIQYKDYAAWHNRVKENDAFESQERYWLTEFKGEIPVLTLPTDRPRPMVQQYEGATVAFTIENHQRNAINTQSRQQGVTPFMMLMAAYHILLEKLSGQEEIVVGTPVAGRSHDELQQMVGVFINTLPIKAIPFGEKTTREFIGEIGKKARDAFSNQDYPYEEMVEQLAVERDAGRNPMFDVMFVFQNMPMTALQLPDLEITPLRNHTGTAKFDLQLTAEETAQGISFVMEYATHLFKEETIHRYVNYFKRIIGSITENPDQSLKDINILSQQEKKTILYDYNQTTKTYPNDKTIHQLFQEQVERHPDATAVEFENIKISYSQLNQKSNSLARFLRKTGVTPGTIIGILAHRSHQLIIAIIATLKSGGAYMPIDPEFSDKRIRFMVEDSAAKTIITTTELHHKAGAIAKTNALNLDKSILFREPGEILENRNQPNNLAYVIYTSGSTGRPKGVMISHGAAVNYINWAIDTYVRGETVNFPLLTSIAFDLTVTTLFTPLLSGNTMIVYEKEEKQQLTEELLRDNKSHVVKLTPSHLKLIRSLGITSNIKRFIVGGEELETSLVEDLNRQFGNQIEIFNEYGPTEATVGCTIYLCNVNNDTPKTQSIGKPINNTQIYILDKSLNPVPVGTVGELYVAGDGLAEGYLNRPELTAEKFIEAPWIKNKYPTANTSERLYKTGDLARWHSDGNIEYLGRIDYQVKIRGFRIELGEIESRLIKHQEVDNAVVICRTNEEEEKYLCAYITPKPGEVIQNEQIRANLTEDLPDYMIPAHIIQLEKMPVNSSGKLDRKALPQPEKTIDSNYTPPANKTEAQLAKIWSRLLDQKIEAIGIHDNFFHHGGHSLKAAALVNKIHKEFSVDINISDIFKYPTIQGIATHIKRSRVKIYQSIASVEKKEYYRLSSSQNRLYILQQLAHDNTGYNVPAAFKVTGSLDTSKLETAFRRLIHRHEALRTSFVMSDDKPVQRVHEIDEIKFRVEACESTAIEDFVSPFDLASAPLLRVGFVKCGDQKHTLLLDMHHIVSDGTTVGVLVKEFIALYNNEKLPEPAIQYKDYAEWHNRAKEDYAFEHQERYWVTEFEGEIPLLMLPYDYPRPAVQQYEGAAVDFTIEDHQRNAINTLSKQQGVTPFMVLLAAYNILLTRLSGQEEIVVGTPVAGRSHDDLQQMVGVFINTLPIKALPHGLQTTWEFIGEIGKKARDAFSNQDYPYEEMVEQLAVERDAGRNPLFDVMFVLQNMPMTALKLPELEITPLQNHTGIAKFDLQLTAEETARGYVFVMEYATHLFKKETIHRYVNYFKRIIDSITQNPTQSLKDIAILSEEEKQETLYGFNDTDAYTPADKLIHQFLEEQAERTPNQPAVIGNRIADTLPLHLTYREFNQKADQLAQQFKQKGVGANTIVAVKVRRSIEMLTTIYAILKAGAAYLPIDPDTPGERIDYMIKDSNPGIILDGKQLALMYDSLHQQVSLTDGSAPNDLHKTPRQPAYIIYTSGSTGRPKGVMLEHASVVNIIWALQQKYPLEEQDTFLFKTSYIFDVSVAEIFGWFFGGRLAILPDGYEKEPQKIIETIETETITHINFVPSMFSVFIEQLGTENIGRLNSLKYIFLAGEALPASQVIRFIQLKSDSPRLENLYGPTEGTIYASGYSLKEWDKKAGVPIGKPLANVKLYVLDKHRNPQPPGVPGELYITGTGLARGYLNQPELTAEKFNFHIFDRIAPKNTTTAFKSYKTGDLVRWKPDGNIEFLGRLDNQVKIRGYRIELGEIESRLLNHPAISEAAVIVTGKEEIDYRIAAYIVLHQPETHNPEELRNYLSEGLPEYMDPSFIVTLDTMPLTPSGKINRKALPEPERQIDIEFTPPSTEIEKNLAHIWGNILNRDPEKVSIHENFFHLGGHSLKAVRLASRINKIYPAAITLSDIFKNPTLQDISRCIAERNTNKTDVTVSIDAVEKSDYYKLSSAQKRLYVLHQLDSENTVYNMPAAYQIDGDPDHDRLEEAFKQLIHRHESLRTTFHMVEGSPVQFIYPANAIEFEIRHLETQAIHDFIRPFDLTKPPLFRAGIIEINHNRRVLVVDMHHIISDGTSLGILINEFAYQYNGLTLPAPAIQYKDYSHWQNQRQETDVMKDQESYWLEQFAEEHPLLDLPTDAPRPATRDFSGNTIPFTLGKEQTQQLNETAAQEGVTLFMLLLAAMNVYLAKLCGQEHIVIGTPNAGRNHQDLENIIGMFVNTLTIANQPTGEKTFKQFLAEVKTKTLEAFENQDYQFEDLVDKVVTQRDTSRNPLFDVMFGLQNIDMQPLEIPGLTVKPYSIENRTTRFDMTFLAREEGQQLHFTLEYSTALFKEETIKRFIGYFRHLVEELTTNTHREISRYSIISAQEKQRLQQEFNRTNTDYPADKTIHQLFRQQVEAAPDHIALEGRSLLAHSERKSEQGTVALTYRELDSRTSQLAYQLRAKGVEHGSLVGLQVERSVEIIIAILAILKAGGAYMPIDPGYPTERIRYMQRDSNAVIHLEEAELLTILGTTNRTTRDASLPHSPLPDPAAAPAYVLYTSGSSGRPKGVLVKHRNVVRLVQNTNYVRFQPGERLLQTGAVEFDASTFEIWGALLNGMVLCIAPKENMLSPEKLKATIRKTNTNTMWLTSPLFNQLARVDSGIFEGLENLLVGGDVLSPGHINAVRRKNPSLNIINGYGPTENTTFSTTYLIREEHTRNIPIGTPIANSTALILDKTNQTAPIGIAGELHVGGDGVAHGYLNNPELTAEKFIRLPFTNPPSLFYKTGDQARWTPNGTIEFLGRIDQQVKIRGYRIELEEIENRLLQSPEIKDARVICRQDGKKEKSICAYIVPYTPDNCSTQTIRDNLKRELPDHMIPSHFITLENMPLTPNGKVDTRALPEPGITGNNNYQAPGTETESQLANIWSEVLEVAPETIGVHDNFFHLGGHSLKAVALIALIHKTFNVKIPLAEIFESPSIKEMAEFVTRAECGRYLQIEPVEKKEFYPLSAAQKRLFILYMMDKTSTGYNIPSIRLLEGKLEKKRFENAFQAIINRHESLRTSFEMIEDEPVQRIHEQATFEIRYYDIAPGDETQPESIISDFIRPFELSNPPLIRIGLISIPQNRHILIVDMHHIISDGTSMNLLIKDFMTVYGGGNLTPTRLQYKDVSEYQARIDLQDQAEYWKKQFEDDIPVLELPVDRPRQETPDYKGQTETFEIDRETTGALERLAESHGATVYMVLLAIYNILLSKISTQEDIVVGSPVAGRRHAEQADIIGMFINTLATRNYPGGEKVFQHFLEEVKKQTLQDFENQDYPFEELVEQLSINRDTGRNPLFDVMLVLQNFKQENLEIPGLTLKPYPYELNSTKFDMTLAVTLKDNRLQCTFTYSTALFESSTIRRIIGYFKRIIDASISNSRITLNNISILSEEEKHQLVEIFNDTKASYPQEKSISRLFEEQAERSPEKIAVVWDRGKHSMSYGELDRNARHLANTLRLRGVEPGNIVGIITGPSPKTVIAILAVLKTGAAYMPIDPKNPEDRVQYMKKDSNAVFILTDEEITTQCDAKDCVCRSTSSLSTQSNRLNEELCYVIYTSGSTGKPKGVLLKNHNLVNYVNWFSKKTKLTTDDRSALLSSFAFDLGYTAIYPTILTGGQLHIVEETVYLAPEDLLEYLHLHKISYIKLTPSLYSTIVEAPSFTAQKCRFLRLIVLGGEAIKTNDVCRTYEICPELRVMNHYGPTESTIGSVAQYIDRGKIEEYSNRPSIGNPIYNTDVYIINGHTLGLQPVGVPGELCISGAGVARGYLNRPELTAEKFINYKSQIQKDNKNDHFILYRTGDLARWMPNGKLEFLGRMDSQVKIRGYRVELGEIENQLKQIPVIKEAAVITAKNDSNLFAYVVATETVNPIEIREILVTQLPEYAVPQYIIQLERIPLTGNGKLNRRALPEPEHIETNETFEAPRDEIEKKLVEIWSEVLKIDSDKIGVDDDFIQSGGHSLKAIQITTRVHKQINVKISITDIFKYHTIRQLAKFIKETDTSNWKLIEPVENKEYYLMSPAQRRMYILNTMDSNSKVYNLPTAWLFTGILDLEKFKQAFNRIIQRHESLRTSFHLVNGQPVQRIHREIDFSINYEIIDQDIELKEEEYGNLIPERIVPFDLSKASQLAVTIIKIREDIHLLICDMHHIISDAVSKVILMQEFVALYEGSETLQPLKIQYPDISEWQIKYADSTKMKRHERFWLEKFKDNIPVVNLPADYPRPEKQQFEGNTIHEDMDAEMVSQLKQSAAESGTTLYMLMLAAFNILLSKYAGTDDIIVGTPIAGRNHADLEQTIGLFVNTLVLKNTVNENHSFLSFLEEVRKNTLDAYENQDYPLEELINQLGIIKEVNRNPLFDVLFVFEDVESPAFEISNAAITPVEFNTKISHLDIVLYVIEGIDEYRLSLEYSTSLFKQETMEVFLKHYREILEQIVQNKNIPIVDINMTHHLVKAETTIVLDEDDDFVF